jgi:hypothetical protein
MPQQERDLSLARIPRIALIASELCVEERIDYCAKHIPNSHDGRKSTGKLQKSFILRCCHWCYKVPFVQLDQVRS